MAKEIMIKSAIESVLGWVLVAILVNVTRDVPFILVFASPHSIAIEVAVFIGCCIGLRKKAIKQGRAYKF